jgi:carbamoyl-phosphate synthase large subunit
VVPRVGAPDYLDRMLDICRREAVDLFLPALDEELALCGRNRGRFEALGTRLLLSGPRALEVCADKWKMFQFFQHCGVATATTLPVEAYRPGAIPGFPLVVKPRSGRGSAGVFKARNPEELSFFSRYVEGAIVQECLEGVEYTVDVLADLRSRVRILSPRKRLATDSGISSKGGTHWRDDLLGPVRTMVEALELVGPLNFQCFCSPRGVFFTEINARLAGTAILSQAAGVPLFQGILALARGQEPPSWLEPARDLRMLRYWEEVFVRPGEGPGPEA